MESPTEISGTAYEGETTHLSFARQIGLVSRTIFGSPAGKALLVLIAALVAVVAATAYGQIRLNGWNKPFYDALSRRDLRDFLFQLGVFFLIAGILLVLNVAQRWLVETLELKLREGLVLGLLRRLDAAAPGVLAGQCGIDRASIRISAYTRMRASSASCRPILP